MMKNFLILFYALFLFSCGATNPTKENGQPDGKALYEQNCSICHGDDGKLGAAGASDLSTSRISLEERITIITNGKGQMAPFKDLLDEEQRKAVAVYIESFRK